MPGCLSWRSLRGGGGDVEERRGLRMQCQKSEGAGSRGVGRPASRRACPEEGGRRLTCLHCYSELEGVEEFEESTVWRQHDVTSSGRVRGGGAFVTGLQGDEVLRQAFLCSQTQSAGSAAATVVQARVVTEPTDGAANCCSEVARGPAMAGVRGGQGVALAIEATEERAA
eukprot:1723607-Rhodomonas_salina.1